MILLSVAVAVEAFVFFGLHQSKLFKSKPVQYIAVPIILGLMGAVSIYFRTVTLKFIYFQF